MPIRKLKSNLKSSPNKGEISKQYFTYTTKQTNFIYLLKFLFYIKSTLNLQMFERLDETIN